VSANSRGASEKVKTSRKFTAWYSNIEQERGKEAISNPALTYSVEIRSL